MDPDRHCTCRASDSDSKQEHQQHHLRHSNFTYGKYLPDFSISACPYSKTASSALHHALVLFRVERGRDPVFEIVVERNKKSATSQRYCPFLLHQNLDSYIDSSPAAVIQSDNYNTAY